MKTLLLNRHVKRLVEACIAALALFLAFHIRFEGSIPSPYDAQLPQWLALIAVARVGATYLARLSNQKWRYTTLEDAARVGVAQTAPTVVLLVLRLTLAEGSWLALPIGVIAADFLLSVLMALGIRLVWRTACEWRTEARDGGGSKRLLLLGAGHHGAMIASELARKKGVTVVGFLDDNKDRQGAMVAGRKVLGPTSLLEQCVKDNEVDDVLVCIPPAERNGLDLKALGKGTARMTFVPTVEDVLQSDWASVQPRKPSAPRRHALVSIPKERRLSPVANRKILITGGAGFIGSSLAARLAPRNDVTLFDLTFENKPIGHTNLLNSTAVRCVEGDILDEELLSSLARDSEIVIHAAAVLGVSRVCSAARDTLETNYVGTARLLHALEGNKNLKRFIYFSTSEVFGINSYRVTEDTPSSIGSSTESRWSYAIAKVAGEHLVQSYHRDVGTPAVIVRPFNVFGPRRTADYALMRFISSAFRDEPVVVHGDGSQIRAWCYIDDFCDAILAMIERPDAVGEDFNIGNPANTTTIYDLARRVIDLAGSSSPIAFIENPFPDISIRVPCLNKAERILDYKPQFDLDTGLSLTLDWHRAHMLRGPGRALAIDKDHVERAALAL